LSGIVNYFIVIYFDDILVYFKLKKDYYAYIKIVIKRLKKYKLYIKLNKYFFNIKEVEFLGFIISIIRVKPDFNKILIIKKWLKPELFYEV
jgi:Reverse transcriptase (RNA-dependent DNA polymerase)